MSLVLGPRASRCLLATLAFAAAAYAFLCIRSFRASELASSQELSKQVVAAHIEPQNADYWRQLGATRLYRNNDPQAALLALHQATNLNPRNADAWMATALALQLLNRPKEERDAISGALAAEPSRLEIIWQAENLYATLGDRHATVQEACVLLAHDHARAAAAMDLARELAPGITAADCSAEQETH